MLNSQLTKSDNPWEEINKLRKRMDKAKNPNPKDVERLRQFAARTPGLQSVAATVLSIQQQLIKKICHGASRGFIFAEVDVLKKQFEHSAAPPLERLLIDHMLTARLRLLHAENLYNCLVVNQPVPLKVAEYWDNLLSTTQARFLRAVEALARVRRLARNTPALQINIANAGGQQVNAQGDVKGQKSNG